MDLFEVSAENVLTDEYRCEATYHATEWFGNWYHSPDGFTGDLFTIDLGCHANIGQLSIKNSHCDHWVNRGLKDFIFHVSNDNVNWMVYDEQHQLAHAEDHR